MYNQELVENNLGLVKKLAYEYACKTHLEYEDLFQEGVLGLIRASEKFDPEMGNAFSTYAVWWIKQKMQRYLEAQMPVSKSVRKHRAKVYAMRQQLEAEGEEVTPELIAERLDMRLSDVLGILSPDTISIYTPLGDGDSENCLIDTMVADEKPIGDNIEKEEVSIMIRKAMAGLSEKERNVIFKRYFSVPGTVVTYDEMSQEMGVSKQRIQQIEKNALNKLKHTKYLLEYSRLN